MGEKVGRSFRNQICSPARESGLHNIAGLAAKKERKGKEGRGQRGGKETLAVKPNGYIPRKFFGGTGLKLGGGGSQN